MKKQQLSSLLSSSYYSLVIENYDRKAIRRQLKMYLKQMHIFYKQGKDILAKMLSDAAADLKRVLLVIRTVDINPNMKLA